MQNTRSDFLGGNDMIVENKTLVQNTRNEKKHQSKMQPFRKPGKNTWFQNSAKCNLPIVKCRIQNLPLVKNT